MKCKAGFLFLSISLGLITSFFLVFLVEQQAARIKGLKEFLNCVGSAPKGKSQREDAQSFSVATKLLSKKTIWRGGSESHTFNRLEEIALNWNAMTPVLGCRISRVLESSKVNVCTFSIFLWSNTTIQQYPYMPSTLFVPFNSRLVEITYQVESIGLFKVLPLITCTCYW